MEGLGFHFVNLTTTILEFPLSPLTAEDSIILH